MSDDTIKRVVLLLLEICGKVLGKTMRRKRGKCILTLLIASVIPLVLLTGCHNEEKAKASRAYYVISEELDVQKTVDKAQEILENAESQHNSK